MFPMAKAGERQSLDMRLDYPPGMEPDWIKLVRSIFQEHDPARVSAAADMVLQSRPRERLLYRRLCKVYQIMPTEGVLPLIPNQG